MEYLSKIAEDRVDVSLLNASTTGREQVTVHGRIASLLTCGEGRSRRDGVSFSR